VLVVAAVAFVGAIIAFVWLPARASYDALAEGAPDTAPEEPADMVSADA
jgi:hypothetical protein